MQPPGPNARAYGLLPFCLVLACAYTRPTGVAAGLGRVPELDGLQQLAAGLLSRSALARVFLDQAGRPHLGCTSWAGSLAAWPTRG